MRKRIAIIAIILVLGAGITIGVRMLTAPGAPAGMPEHITIAQALADRSGKSLKVGGEVVPGSIVWNDRSGLTFTLTGEGDRMQVAYRGLAPADFKPGLALVVEGEYTSGGVLEATALVPRNSPLCRACHG